MDTTNNSETPQRRVDDRAPAATINWEAPGAPAVPVRQPQPAAPGFLANEQIGAGAAVKCDHGQPIGRNVAIDVFDAMNSAASAAIPALPADLQQLNALALAATPGPWTATHWNGHAPTSVMLSGTTMVIAETTGFGRDSSECAPDAAYIAAANPAVVLDLIARIAHERSVAVSWQRTAEKKDRDWNEARMAFENYKCEQRATAPHAAPVVAGAELDLRDLGRLFAEAQETGQPVTLSASACGTLFNAMTTGAAPHGSAAPTEAAPVSSDGLPRWIDNLKGSDPTIDNLIEYILSQRAAAPVSGGELPKPWRERIVHDYYRDPSNPGLVLTGASACLAARDAEIAELRAAVSSSQAAPKLELPPLLKMRLEAAIYHLNNEKFTDAKGCISDALKSLAAPVASQAAPVEGEKIATWQERTVGRELNGMTTFNAMRAEIVDLRAAVAASQAAPVGGSSRDDKEFCAVLRDFETTHSYRAREAIFDYADARRTAVAAAKVQAGERELLERAYRVISCAAIAQIRDGEATWKDLGDYLAAPVEQGQGAAPSEKAADAVQYLNNVATDAVRMLSKDWPNTAELLKGAVAGISKASPVGAGVVPEGCDRCEGGYIYNTNHTLRMPCHDCPPTAATADPVAADDPVRDAEGESWVRVADRLPEVPEDSEKQFIVACRRKNGKTYVFAADYLNARQLHNDEEGDVTLTGWYIEGSHPDYNGWFDPVCQEGDEVTHWMPMPECPASASRTTAHGGAQGEQQ